MATSEQYLVDEAGKRTAVLVPVEEWERIQAALEDLKEKTERAQWDDPMGAQAASLAAVWDNPEDEVWKQPQAGRPDNPRKTPTNQRP